MTMISEQEQYRRAQHYSDSAAFDPPEDIECPECDSIMEEIDRWSSRCPECNYLIEPDYETLIKDRYDDF